MRGVSMAVKRLWMSCDGDALVDTPPGAHRCGSLLTASGEPCRQVVWNRYRWCRHHFRRERARQRTWRVVGELDAERTEARN